MYYCRLIDIYLIMHLKQLNITFMVIIDIKFQAHPIMLVDIFTIIPPNNNGRGRLIRFNHYRRINDCV